MKLLKHLSLAVAVAAVAACSSSTEPSVTTESDLTGPWVKQGAGTAGDVVAMTSTAGALYAVTSGGLMERQALPLAAGGTWSSLGSTFMTLFRGPPPPRVVALAASDAAIYAATDTNGVYSATVACLAAPPHNMAAYCMTRIGTGPGGVANPIVALAYLDGALYAATQTNDSHNLWSCTAASCTSWAAAGAATSPSSMTADPTTHLLFASAPPNDLYWKRPTDAGWTILHASTSLVGMGIHRVGSDATLFGATSTSTGTFGMAGSLMTMELCDVAATCAATHATCGTVTSDPVCGAISCGGCAAGQTCTSANTCCAPSTCAAHHATCGAVADGCGGTLNCGSCAAGSTCNGANTCSCAPTTCAAHHATCGTIADGCGGTLNCGSCAAGSTCNGANTCSCVEHSYCFDCFILETFTDQYGDPYQQWVEAPHTIAATGCSPGEAAASLTGTSTLGCGAVGTSPIACR